MFKRIIKIILILLAVFLLVLGIIWLIGRHTAEKNGTKVLSFKQFIGLSSKEGTTGTAGIGGANSSNFGNNGNGNGSINGNGSNGTSGVGSSGNGTVGNTGDITNISTFTGNEISPTGVGNVGSGTGGNNNGANGNGTSNGSGNGTGNANGKVGSGSGSGSSSSGSTAPVCGSADTNITFTPLELSELNALQNRFYSLAQTLHTDQDVATELANHDAFALKADQVTEDYNFCQSLLPSITDASLQAHVATPFWDAWNVTDTPGDQWDNGASQTDSQSFMYFPPGSPTYNYLTQTHDNDQQNPDTSGILGPYGQYTFSNPTYVIIDGSILGYNAGTAVLMMPVVEHILRVNLW